jgi:hypothetical protein
MSEENKKTASAEENKNFSYGDWDADFKENTNQPNGNASGERRKTNYMTFDKPGVYQVRLFGKFVKFYSHWQPFDRKIITLKEWSKEDPATVAGFYPRQAWAIHVIDRKDGSVKVLEKGKKIFECFANYKTVNNINPASPTEAPDFQIKVEWPKGNKRAAVYSVTALAKPSPLTKEEIEKCKAEKYPLELMYKTTPLEKIKELWAALPEEKKIKPVEDEEGNTSKSKTTTAPKKTEVIEEPMDDSPATKDDLFGDNGDAGTAGEDSPF